MFNDDLEKGLVDIEEALRKLDKYKPGYPAVKPAAETAPAERPETSAPSKSVSGQFICPKCGEQFIPDGNFSGIPVNHKPQNADPPVQAPAATPPLEEKPAPKAPEKDPSPAPPPTIPKQSPPIKFGKAAAVVILGLAAAGLANKYLLPKVMQRTARVAAPAEAKAASPDTKTSQPEKSSQPEKAAEAPATAAAQTDKDLRLLQKLDDYEANHAKYCTFTKTEKISPKYDVFQIKKQRRYKCDKGIRIVVSDGEYVLLSESTLPIAESIQTLGIDGPAAVALGILGGYFNAANTIEHPDAKGGEMARLLGYQAINEPGKVSSDVIWGFGFMTWVDPDGDTAHVATMHPQTLKMIQLKKIRGK